MAADQPRPLRERAPRPTRDLTNGGFSHEDVQVLYRSGGSLAEWWSSLQELVTGEVDFPDPQETFLALAYLIEPGGDDGDLG